MRKKREGYEGVVVTRYDMTSDMTSDDMISHNITLHHHITLTALKLSNLMPSSSACNPGNHL